MNKNKIIILSLSFMSFLPALAFIIGGEESKQWIVDYSTGETTEFEVESPEELFSYIRENVKPEMSVTNDDSGSLIDVTIDNGVFYNYMTTYNGEYLTKNNFFWTTNNRIECGGWYTFIINNTEREYEDMDSWMLPAIEGSLELFEDTNISDLKINLITLDLVEIPAVPLIPFFWDQNDSPSNGINSILTNGSTTKSSDKSKNMEFMPKDLIKIFYDRYYLDGKRIITYLGQYTEEPCKLRAVKHIKYRIEGAHYFFQQSNIKIAEHEPRKDKTIYDLYGREVKTILPGSVYIQNGKKFIGK